MLAGVLALWELRLTWYSHIDPAKTVEIVNYMRTHARGAAAGPVSGAGLRHGHPAHESLCRPTPPASITQISSDYVTINGKYARYRAVSSAINNIGLLYVFNEQVNIPSYNSSRALWGTLDGGANGHKWDFETEVTHPSLVSYSGIRGYNL